MTRTRLPLLALLALALLVPALAQSAPGPAPTGPSPLAKVAAKDPARVALVQARRLAADWGRCPTARPAHRLLAIATRTRAQRPRVLRARASVRAWRAVARDCSKPIPSPSVIVGEVGFTPAPGA